MNIISQKQADHLLANAWKRSKYSVKGDSGRVLIIGGSEEYAGCLALAGTAALRAGSDWVTIAAPEKVAWAINKKADDLVSVKLKGADFTKKHLKLLQELINKHSVFLIGQGMSNASAPIIRALVKNNPDKPKVLDANAIYQVKLDEAENALFTPNKKEFEFMYHNLKIRRHNNVVLKKGAVDEIISRDRIIYNKTGNPGMTKAGTGDVLAGLAAGSIAQGLELFDAACLAAFITGQAGDNLKKQKGFSFLASDLLEDMKRFRRRGADRR